MTYTITWEGGVEDKDGRLVAKDEAGNTISVQWEDPITASSDSHAIAAALDLDDGIIDHDKEYVFVTYI